MIADSLTNFYRGDVNKMSEYSKSQLPEMVARMYAKAHPEYKTKAFKANLVDYKLRIVDTELKTELFWDIEVADE